MEAVELVQIGHQELGGHRVAGADDEGAQQQLLGLGQLVLTCRQQAQGTADVLVEHLPLAGEADAPGAPGEQPGLEGRLQLFDGLAHRRLGNIQVLGGHGDVAGLGHFLEHAVQFQLDCHEDPS